MGSAPTANTSTRRREARGRCRSLGTATGTYGMPGVLVFCSLYRKKGSPEEKEKVMHFATEVWELPEEWFKE
jgi:hypothetical protein